MKRIPAIVVSAFRVNKPGILFASLALNLIVAAALVVVVGRPSASPPTQTVIVDQLASDRFAAEPHQPTTNPPALASQPAKFHWGLIESADYRQYIDNLRAIGCPERLIRDIIIADVGKLYADKMGEVNAPWGDWQPWYGRDRSQARHRDRSQRISTLQAEQRALLKELLGIEPNTQASEFIHNGGTIAIALGFLSEPKPSELVAMIDRFSDATREVDDKARGILLKEDREQLARLRQDLMSKFSAMMSPAEFEELSLRAQGLGKFMEGDIHLEGVSLSGAEFRQLCGLSRITGDVIQDEILRDRTELSEEEEEHRQKAFEAEVKKLLGLARFADFQRAQQPEFREALNFTEENHLPVSAAAKVSAAVRHANEQAEAIKQNQALSPDEQAAALTVLRSVTVNALSSALGTKYAEYAKSNGTNLEDLFELPSDSAEGSR